MAVLAVVAALVVSLGGLVVWRSAGSEYVVTRPGSTADPSADPTAEPTVDPGARVDAAGARRALAGLVAAIDARDAAAATALAGPDAGGLLAAVTANAAALDVSDLGLRYVAEAGTPPDAGPAGEETGWRAAVELSWRFAGVDPGVATQEVAVDFSVVDDTVRIDGLGGGERGTPLWLTGPLEVRRSSAALVLAAPGAESADVLLARATEAVSVVGRVLPDWSGPLVVEAAGSQAAMAAALGAEPDGYASVAAVSASVDGSTRDETPIHVFVNPAVYDGLDPVGAQVVISHEATHVATDAPLRVLPPWLLEGFADYVALRDVDLPLSTTAGQVRAQVRADGAPAALPDQTDFAQGTDGFGAAYEAAWLACRVLAERAGEPALVEVYRRVSDGVPLRRALREGAGIGLAELTRAWQDRLRELAA